MERSVLAKYGLFAAFVAIGGATGLYLSGGWSSDRSSCCREPVSPVTPVEPEAQPTASRFPLTALDAKDTVEAPELALGADGAVFLAWASKTGATERSVFFTRSTNAGQSFDAPKVLSQAGIYKSVPKGGGKSGGFERRANPHLAAVGTQLHLAWGEARADGAGMRLVLATSTDAGTTFGAPRPVHSGDRANPTFTSLTAGPGGALACAWLDDRAGIQQPFASVCRIGTGTFEPEQVIYPGQPEVGVCPCCPTGACFGPDGTLYAAFRNVKDGYRDMAIGRLKPGQSHFDGPFPVVSNTWKFDGCPHDGPSLVVVGDTLHVVWMDARSGPQRCYYARANTSAMTFAARELHPGVPGTQGNAKLFAEPNGALHVVWEESLGAEPPAEGGHQHGAPKVGVGGGRAVMYAVMPAGQTVFGAARAIGPKPGTFQTRPSVAVGADGSAFVAWNELDATGKAVVVTRVAGSSVGGQQ